MRLLPTAQRVVGGRIALTAFDGVMVMFVPFGHCEAGQPETILKWSGGEFVANAPLFSRSGLLFVAMKLVPQVLKGKTCS